MRSVVWRTGWAVMGLQSHRDLHSIAFFVGYNFTCSFTFGAITFYIPHFSQLLRARDPAGTVVEKDDAPRTSFTHVHRRSWFRVTSLHVMSVFDWWRKSENPLGTHIEANSKVDLNPELYWCEVLPTVCAALFFFILLCIITVVEMQLVHPLIDLIKCTKRICMHTHRLSHHEINN